jgi:hypothetical protein
MAGIPYGNRRADILTQLSQKERLTFIAEGLPTIAASARSFEPPQRLERAPCMPGSFARRRRRATSLRSPNVSRIWKAYRNRPFVHDRVPARCASEPSDLAPPVN